MIWLALLLLSCMGNRSYSDLNLDEAQRLRGSKQSRKAIQNLRGEHLLHHRDPSRHRDVPHHGVHPHRQRQHTRPAPSPTAYLPTPIRRDRVQFGAIRRDRVLFGADFMGKNICFFYQYFRSKRKKTIRRDRRDRRSEVK
ncbi:hypothetical protein LINPERPRIM_LOCUS27667 [Linum perenne]